MLCPEGERPEFMATSSAESAQADEEDSAKITSSKADRALPEDEKERLLSNLTASQNDLLENMKICDNMLIQLRKLKASFADKPNADTKNKVVTQEVEEDISEDYKSQTQIQDEETSEVKLAENKTEIEDEPKEELEAKQDDTMQHTENTDI
ncbi:uncharacterized protein ACMZJ9_001989 [Mantella aurantiaca]